MSGHWAPMPKNLTLSPHEVHLFLAATDLPAITLSRLESLLSVEERERVARLRITSKRVESLVARGMLRQVLAGFLHTAPQEIKFIANAHGKPLLDNSSQLPWLHFNLSHTAGQVLLAVTQEGELGVDIECHRPDIEHEDLAQRFFTAKEHAALIALPERDRLPAFFRCWTRKEAILKATGRGIGGGLDSFEVPIYPSATSIQVGLWTFHDLPVAAGYSAALATGWPDAHIHRWMFEG